jgi:hypothetical protein
MPKVAIRSLEQLEPAPTPSGAEGSVETRSYFDGERHPIHLHLHRLASGARLPLVAEEADLCLYVWEGEVVAGDTELDERSSAVVQRGAELVVTAGRKGASLLLFKAREGQGTGEGHVFLLPNARVPRTFAMGGNEGIGGALHADAHEPTPNIWLHENDYAMADKETELHSHSEDEVLFVRAGSVRIGNNLFGRGTALAIAADTLYEFWSGPDGLSFVNFRATSPTYRKADGSLVLDEAELWRKAVGKPEFLLAGAD